MKRTKDITITAMALLMTLSACDKEVGKDMSFLGKPLDVNISMDANMTTRTAVSDWSGSVYLKTTLSDATLKRYTYDSSLGYTSANPLVWTAEELTVNGFYIDGGGTAPNNNYSYTVDAELGQTSYLAGQQTVNYHTSRDLNITLRQQLAKITITVNVNDGSELSNPMLGGGVLYESGSLDVSKGAFDSNGYATGGTNGCGWTTNTQLDPVTISMVLTASTETSYTYSAVIMPQTISNTSVSFFSVEASNGAIGHTAGYSLAAATTFKAGYTYSLKVDDVTNTLYLEQVIEIDDFKEPQSADMIDISNVTKVS